jgi:hypothetical protein
MRGLAVVVSLLCMVAVVCAEESVLLDADFENADLTGWRVSGDLCVAPAFCAGQPSGKYWIAFSTNSQKGDPITLCGASSVEGMESILQSPYLPLPFAPSQVRVDFDVKFLTNENTTSDLGTDSFLVRLLTMSGPVVIANIDDGGTSPDTKNLKISGDARFHESGCTPTWRYETGMLHVSYYRTFHGEVKARIRSGPVALEFLLNNHFDQNFDSAVVIDNVRFSVFR